MIAKLMSLYAESRDQLLTNLAAEIALLADDKDLCRALVCEFETQVTCHGVALALRSVKPQQLQISPDFYNWEDQKVRFHLSVYVRGSTSRRLFSLPLSAFNSADTLSNWRRAVVARARTEEVTDARDLLRRKAEAERKLARVPKKILEEATKGR